MKRFILSLLLFVLLAVAALVIYVATRSEEENSRWLARILTDQLGRDVTVSGPTNIQWSNSPTILVKGLQVANTAWGKNEYLLRLDEGLLQLPLTGLLIGRPSITRLELLGLAFNAEKNSSGKGNWEFGGLQPSSSNDTKSSDSCGSIPDIRHLSIASSVLSFEEKKQQHKVLVGNLGLNSTGSTRPLGADFAGTINGTQYTISGELLRSDDAMGNLRKVHAQIATNFVSFETSAALRPSSGSCLIDATISAKGANLAELNRFVSVSLPSLGPYSLTSGFKNPAERFEFDNLKLTIGSSDLSGAVHLETQTKRLAVTAVLASELFRIEDFTTTAIADVEDDDSNSGNQRKLIFSKEELPLELLHTIALDTEFKVKKLELSDHWLLTNLQFKAMTDDRHADAELLQAKLFDGDVKGKLTLSNLHDVPQLKLSADLDQVELGRLLEQEESLKAKSDLDIQLSGSGRSLHELARRSNGHARLVSLNGHVDKEFTSFLSMEVRDLLSPVLGDSDRSDLHCFVSDFFIENGIAKSRKFLIHASDLALLGEGQVNLAEEETNMTFQLKSDRPGVETAITMYTVSGNFLDQKIRTVPDVLEAGQKIVNSTVTIAKNTAQSAQETVGNTVNNTVAKIIGSSDPQELSRICREALETIEKTEE